ncbi:hypothetical protein [uncultured Desulfovibrio sp.]|uniref:hypothetical protein n=1 Tax=uncultured Desulfovibrio sp. TaxID=167968 RepID=UPI002621D88C|nr:hypothetical protein [uncultured Desulfovibrio sp.]
MGFYSDILSSASSALITVPLLNFSDISNSVAGSFGVSLPVASLPNLDKLGLFSHSTAEKLAKAVLEPHGPTVTSHWMDAVKEYSHLYPKGIQLGYHRVLHGHHFITDFFRTLSDKNLSCIDFCKHLGTDIVTKNGLPLLPSSTVQSISDILGVSVTKISPWISFNILDCASSVLAVGHAGSNVVDIIAGTAQWSGGYAFNSFGVGAVEIISGYCTSNPVLIVSGSSDIICGTITACEYYSQQFLCGVPIIEILQSSLFGASIATVFSCVDLFINRNSPSYSTKLKELSSRILISGFVSALSVISAPVAITVASGYTGYKLVRSLAHNSEKYLESIPIIGNFTKVIDNNILEKHHNRNICNNSLGKYYLETLGRFNYDR